MCEAIYAWVGLGTQVFGGGIERESASRTARLRCVSRAGHIADRVRNLGSRRSNAVTAEAIPLVSIN